MRMRFLLPLLLLPALATAPALAQVPAEPDAEALQRAEAASQAWQAYVLRVARALGRSDGARDLALAALLEASARPLDEEGAPTGPVVAESARWRADAASRGATDAISQQLLVAAALLDGDGAAATAAARRWQAISPGNLAPLLLQDLEPDALLSAAALARHHAPEPMALQRWIAGALRGHPPTAAEWAAFGEGARPDAAAHAAIWASSLYGTLLPAYQDLLAACTGSPLRLPGRAEACGHLSGLMLARPQTVLDERIGLSLARALTRTAAERAPLDARRRGVDWRQEQMAELAEEAGDAGSAQAFARALADASVDSEQALVRRALSEARLAQEPPAGWRARWQR